MKKVFWEDPYLCEYKAKVREINGNKIKLYESIFFAFSGGQESDKGTINDIKVINAIKTGSKEDIIDIEYELEKEPNFKIGDTVKIKIDKDRRYKLMRLHSAAHIVYYFLKEEISNFKIIGSHISEEKARIDISYEKNIVEIIDRIQEKVKDFINKGHEIITEYDKEKPDLRWWLCSNWKMPCGGTHIKNTKEIGKISLRRKNLGKGKERIEIYLIE